MINQMNFGISRKCGLNYSKVIDVVFQIYFVRSILKCELDELDWGLSITYQINDKLFCTRLKSEANNISGFVFRQT